MRNINMLAIPITAGARPGGYRIIRFALATDREGICLPWQRQVKTQPSEHHQADA